MSIWNKVKEGFRVGHVGALLLGLAACAAYADSSGVSKMDISQLAPTAAVQKMITPSLSSSNFFLKGLTIQQAVDVVHSDNSHLMPLLKEVNERFNRGIQYQSDQSLYGVTDYYATPTETLARGAGDCEDFVAVKYAALIKKGVDPASLKFMYVKTNMGESHMVLAVFDQEKDPYVLDNMMSSVYRVSQRPDLKHVFSFNQFGGAVTLAKSAHEFNIERVSKADELFKRASELGDIGNSVRNNYSSVASLN